MDLDGIREKVRNNRAEPGLYNYFSWSDFVRL